MPTPPAKPSRIRLTNEQRVQIVRHKAQNPSITQRDLAVWAHTAFNLAQVPSQAMVSKILKRKEELESIPSSQLSVRSRVAPRSPALDAALAKWVTWCEETGGSVTGEAIRAKATRFAALLKIDEPPHWSNGWLHRFNLRHGFSSRKLQGKGATSTRELQKQLKELEPRNIFSMVETRLFYAAPARLEEKMAQKKRVTIAFGCNADGSERLEPLFIGKNTSAKKKEEEAETDQNYTTNAEAWMTRGFFFKWLGQLDEKFRLEDRKCVFVLEDAAFHDSLDESSLTNVEVLFLSGEEVTTNKSQPLDAGIIAAFKKRYRQQQVQHALKTIGANPMVNMISAAKVCDVGVRQAISWSVECWKSIPSSAFINCWAATGLLDGEPADEYFCGIDNAEVSAECEAENPNGNAGNKDLSADEIKEYLKWIDRFLIHADATGISQSSVSGLREMERSLTEDLDRKQGHEDAV